jgi:hypothetical protein
VVKPFKNVDVTMLSPYDGYYSLQKGISVFNDTVSQVKDVTDQLVGLKGIKFTKNAQAKEGTTLKFKNKQPVKLLIGFFNQPNPGYLAAPVLEIDASANNYGQAETKISNAIMVNDVPVNVHAYSFEAGTHTLNLGKGACMLLGFIDDKQEMRIYNAGLDGRGRDIDWLFE